MQKFGTKRSVFIYASIVCVRGCQTALSLLLYAYTQAYTCTFAYTCIYIWLRGTHIHKLTQPLTHSHTHTYTQRWRPAPELPLSHTHTLSHSSHSHTYTHKWRPAPHATPCTPDPSPPSSPPKCLNILLSHTARRGRPGTLRKRCWVGTGAGAQEGTRRSQAPHRPSFPLCLIWKMNFNPK